MSARFRTLPAIICLAAIGFGPLPAACSAKTPSKANSGWRVQETANLRVLSRGKEPVPASTLEKCESLRNELCEKWLAAVQTAWSPKCEIVLHPTESSYLAEVGAGGRSTLASALVNKKQDVVVSRRIDVLATRVDWPAAALPHELTHVVVADSAVGHKIPRWLDEGLAILADSPTKQDLHYRDFQRALEGRATFRLVELFALEDYPAANRWGTFYGESASIVAFLAARDQPAKLLEFLQLADEQGYDIALREVYQIGNVGELDRIWMSAAKRPTTVIASARSATTGSSVQPVGLRKLAAAKSGK